MAINSVKPDVPWLVVNIGRNRKVGPQYERVMPQKSIKKAINLNKINTLMHILPFISVLLQ